ncbi:MAG: Cu(I)-responsive transcriptional regulator [Rhizobiaceae bacterium]|nr:Cu(I)-responsive transcriptional regulator [Rhizobiaceae bacterium]
MNIGDASKASGLPAKTIRYYEDIGLVKPHRLENGYRMFDGDQLNKLKFLQRARGIGFTVEECRALLALYEDKNRTSADVKNIAQNRLGDIDRKMQELQSMRTLLHHLVSSCQGDDRPDCPILDDLADVAPVH